jgi:threonine dehydrogenase-like Zn-dependent dehydrogenase
LVVERPHHLVIHDIPLPIVGDDDALVRVEACGMCGTDHEQYTGELAGGFAGDRVAVECFQSCRDCKACVDGEYRRCERHGLADMYGFISVDRAPGLWGGYADHQYLAPDSMVLKELRIVGAVEVDATAYRAALDVLASGRYPFAELPRRCVGLDEAGERHGVPPVHAVVAP